MQNEVINEFTIENNSHFEREWNYALPENHTIKNATLKVEIFISCQKTGDNKFSEYGYVNLQISKFSINKKYYGDRNMAITGNEKKIIDNFSINTAKGNNFSIKLILYPVIADRGETSGDGGSYMVPVYTKARIKFTLSGTAEG